MTAIALALISRDILIADFERSDYGSWTVTGTAFGSSPARGTLPDQMHVSGYRGQGLVSSFNGGDATTGTLTSPPFKIDRRYISFLIGGGKDLETTAVWLTVDGRPVRKATGPNDRPGGSEALAPAYWDVGELLGKEARIRVIDRATGGWGHVNLDHIVETDKKPVVAVPLVKRTFGGSGRFLNLPIKDGAPLRRVSLVVDGKVVVNNNIGIADGDPDWWAPMDLGDADGPVTLEVADALDDVLKSVSRSAKPRGMKNLYRERLRGQFHFSPARGWTNDPNGLVYYKGEYHLFFQHNPYGWSWENMHWGHAVSKDLIHWVELPDALEPDKEGTIFSGSAVVDQDNTAGFGRDAQVLAYTSAGDKFTQSLAYSTDGRHYTKYAGNPVLPEITNGNRDPKVIWYRPTQRWIMSLYVEENGKHKIVFHSSPDLKHWTREGEVEGFFECPDLFPLLLDGDPGSMKWILTAANSEYMVGSFDGHTFRAETPKLPGVRGQGFYAAQTFSGMPTVHDLPLGRRVQIGWLQTATPGMPFNQSMSLPNELRLVTTVDGPRMTWTPVREFAQLRKTVDGKPDETIDVPSPVKWVRKVPVETEIVATLVPSKGCLVDIDLGGAKITYDAALEELTVDGRKAKAVLHDGKIDLRIFVDRASLEVYALGGLLYMPFPHLTPLDDNVLSICPSRGRLSLEGFTSYQLASIWPRRTQPEAESQA